MEIEAKFTIPDENTYQRLLACRDLAGFRIEPGRTVRNRDQYVDTAERRLLAGGYACRLRREGDTTLVTLKGLSTTADAIHRRDEREVYLAVPSLVPADWPDGPARWLAMELAAGQSLLPLLALEQTRGRRNVYDDQRLVGELTVDQVDTTPGDGQAQPAGEGGGAEDAPSAPGKRTAAGGAQYYELEIELKQSGTEADLQRLSAALREEWRLDPQPLSKFERALAETGAAEATGARPLAPAEQEMLERFTGDRSRPLARRAAIVLAWAAGQPATEIAARIGVSAGRARFWIRSFRARRMAIFTRGRGERLPEPPEAEADAHEALAAPPAAGPGEPAASKPAPASPLPAEPAASAAPAETAPGPAKEPGLSAEDPMSEAGRSIMYTHFRKMCENEQGTREGEDSEALHDMRVATRRMRAAYDLFVPYFDEKTLKTFRKGLRNTGRRLGAVRDLDVLLAKVLKYDERHPAGETETLAPMIAAWRGRRDAGRITMLEYLDSKAYHSFVANFEVFLTTPGAGALARPDGAPLPYQVRHVVPGLISARYQDVRAYEGVLTAAPLTTYHQLRIACKKLRYAMEFFKDVLGEPIAKLIKQVTAMQDLLGDLHDSVVAEELAAEFLTDQIEQRPYQPARLELAGVTAYLSAQWSIQRELLAAFPGQWADLGSYEFRRGLGLALAAL